MWLVLLTLSADYDLYTETPVFRVTIHKHIMALNAHNCVMV